MSKANDTHIFFTCPVIKYFWEEVEKVIKDLLDKGDPCHVKIGRVLTYTIG